MSLISATFLASLVALENTLKVDLIKDFGQPVLASIGNVIANPTIPNVLAQKVVVAGAVIGALPTLETQGVTAVATWLQGELQAGMAAGLGATPTPAATPAAAKAAPFPGA